jgi:hypothetical protein
MTGLGGSVLGLGGSDLNGASERATSASRSSFAAWIVTSLESSKSPESLAPGAGGGGGPGFGNELLVGPRETVAAFGGGDFVGAGGGVELIDGSGRGRGGSGALGIELGRALVTAAADVGRAGIADFELAAAAGRALASSL